MDHAVEMNLADPALAATLELHYLRPTLAALQMDHGAAIDVGAHRGDVTALLAGLGFRVLAIEPQPGLAAQMSERLRPLIDAARVRIETCAASDRRSIAPFFVGRASTVNTLEREWTRVAFPEEFRSTTQLQVPLRMIGDVAAEADFLDPAFVKVDVEGHELPALSGLFRAPLNPPPIVMFEANQRFPEAAEQCLKLLAEHGYDRFDIFVREGIAPLAAQRFDTPALPAAWSCCTSKYFYANLIAYHSSADRRLLPADPVAFVQLYHLSVARDVLRRGLRAEQPRDASVHPIWRKAREELRDYLLHEDWRDFLTHPVCRHMFFRGRWGAGQDRELAALEAHPFGRDLLRSIRDPQAGKPRLSKKLPGLSTNMLGMLYYLHRIERHPGGPLPGRVIEVGGGYGAFAFAYLSKNPQASYVILDLPEMLAIQHYFLTLALPNHRIVFAPDPASVPAPGEIHLIPGFHWDAAPRSCDLLFSTFGFSELPRDFQKQIEQARYFDAATVFIAGQLATEFPDVHLASHEQVVGAAVQQFESVQIERFHTGDNYLLIGSRSAA